MNAIVPRATIDSIVGGRTLALAAFEAAFDTLMSARTLSQFAPAPGLSFDWSGRERFARPDERDKFLTRVRQDIDRGIWNHLLLATNLERLMDATARDQFRDQLEKDPPEATVDNCFATMSALIGDADLIFKRGIATAFSKLDRRFRTHDGFKIGAKVILGRAFQDFGGWNHYRRHNETLRDIERTFLTLDGRPHPDYSGGFLGVVETARRDSYVPGSLTLRAFECEDDYFRLRVFKNGNAHLWFKRADLVEQVNRLLADYYGGALAAGADVADVKHAPKTGVARNFGFFETPEDVRDRVYEAARIGPIHNLNRYASLRILEPSAGLGALARQAARDGHLVSCLEIHPARAAALKESGLYRDVACVDFMEVQPPRPGHHFDAVIMNPPFDGGRDVDHVVHAMKFLRPGGRLAAVMSAGVEFRENRKTVDFRAMVARYGGRFHDLPSGSFSASGTMVNTVICEMQVPA